MAEGKKRRLLWNGDACVATGFERATRYVIDALLPHWEVIVLGMNYFGDPDMDAQGNWRPFEYPIFPASFGGGDSWGLERLPEMLRALKPTVLVVQNDPWNVAQYVHRFSRAVPIVAFMPVDGKNCQGEKLNGLALAVFYTQFALDEARRGGYTGPGVVVPLGVELDVYRPEDKATTRLELGMTAPAAPAEMLKRAYLPEGAFVVGNVNRNQPRKRLDLTISYFADWIKSREIDDAYLYLHLAPTGDRGWNVSQLADYHGIGNRLVITSRKLQPGVGVSESYLSRIYNAFDVQVSTTQGEGFGLTTLEGMACGVPQLVPDWSALGDWPGDAVLKVPCTTYAATPNDINVIGGIADRDAFVEALDGLYRDRSLGAELSRRGLALARQDRFRWDSIGRAFQAALETLDLAAVAAPTLARATA